MSEQVTKPPIKEWRGAILPVRTHYTVHIMWHNKVFIWHSGLCTIPGSTSCSAVPLLRYGCLFKISRILPRRDCHAWDNLRFQNCFCGSTCQRRFCSPYRNNQAWPPPLLEQKTFYMCLYSVFLSVFLIQVYCSILHLIPTTQGRFVRNLWMF